MAVVELLAIVAVCYAPTLFVVWRLMRRDDDERDRSDV
jgi:hypothetical protein